MAGNTLTDIMKIFPVTIPLAGLETPGATTAEFTSDLKDLGAVTWTGTTNPSGLTKKYMFIKRGKNIDLYWFIKASTPGLLVTGCSVEWPSDCPAPAIPAPLGNDTYAYPGKGFMLPSGSQTPSIMSASGIYVSASGVPALKINAFSGLSAGFVLSSVNFLTNG